MPSFWCLVFAFCSGSNVWGFFWFFGFLPFYSKSSDVRCLCQGISYAMPCRAVLCCAARCCGRDGGLIERRKERDRALRTSNSTLIQEIGISVGGGGGVGVESREQKRARVQLTRQCQGGARQQARRANARPPRMACGGALHRRRNGLSALLFHMCRPIRLRPSDGRIAGRGVGWAWVLPGLTWRWFHRLTKRNPSTA